ncbi:hypothetical protein SFRURICE_013258 [Spodoptera frugiperda]|nr:hypothetical protein SFRURICE_013258 [Spodoptera frugiperda]
MPIQCTPTLHNLGYKSHVIGDSVLQLRNYRKTEKKPSNTLPDPGIEPETPRPAVALATTRPTRQSTHNPKSQTPRPVHESNPLHVAWQSVAQPLRQPCSKSRQTKFN